MWASGDGFGNLCLVAFFALLLNLLLGGPPALYSSLAPYHPIALWRQFIGAVNRRLNRESRDRKTRGARGKLVLLVALVILALLGMGLQLALRQLPAHQGDMVEALLLALFFGARPVWDHASAIRRLLRGTVRESYDTALLPLPLMRRDQRSYDRHTVTRAAIEYMALGLTQTVFAPLLAYLFFAWPGVLIVVGVKAMDNQLGYRNRHYAAFGQATARFDSVLQWLPSRLAAFWLCAVAFFAPARPLAAIKVMFSQADKVSSSNAGWPIGAMAGALNLTLAGPRALQGVKIDDQWLGGGSSKAEMADFTRARWLYGIGLLLLLVVLLLLGAR